MAASPANPALPLTPPSARKYHIMITLPSGVEFRPLHIPTSATATDAGDFTEMACVRNLVYTEISGADADLRSADELLPHYRPDPDEIRRVWVAVRGGEVIGRVGIDIPQDAGSRSAYWLVELLHAHHGQGVGAAAYALIEHTARAHGRTVLQSWAEHPATAAGDADRLIPPTGFGSIPLDSAARFYLLHGYTLEQIGRKSALDLVAASGAIGQLRRQAELASVGYRIVQWEAPTPPEHLDGYAWVKSRMSTDAPSAELEFDEEVWDAARVARHDQRYLDGGQRVLVTAAVHEESGRLVAFNELAIGPNRAGATHQEDTLVLREHRGHRLGLLVKCAGLSRWRELVPDSPRVITYNAEENRPMLDINEAIGFAPVSYEGGWKKVLH